METLQIGTITLASQWHSYYRGGGSNQFVVPDPGTGSPDPRDFVLRTVNNLLGWCWCAVRLPSATSPTP